MYRRNFLHGMWFALGAAGPALTAFADGDDMDSPAVPPPAGAKALLDGRSMSGWLTRKGGPAKWKAKDGYLEIEPGTGDIYTQEVFGDHQLHVEFWLPPRAEAKDRSNSGVYVQGRYEVQVLDSYGFPPRNQECAAVYSIAAPLRNASKQPGRWQTFDIAFRGARVEGENVIEKPRITVLHNGVLVQNNLEVPKATPQFLDGDIRRPGPVMLQDHTAPIRFRNIWVFAG